MHPQSGRKQSRWDKFSNQPSPWPQVANPVNNWENGYGPWGPPSAWPHQPYSEFDQFAAAYHSDRRNPHQNPYCWNRNTPRSTPHNGQDVIGSEIVKEAGASQNGEKSQNDQTQGKVVKKTSPKAGQPHQKKKGKKISSNDSHSSTKCKKKVKNPHDHLKNGGNGKNPKKNNVQHPHLKSSREQFKLAKSPQVHHSPAGIQQDDANRFGQSSSSVRRSPRSSMGLLGPPPMLHGRGGLNVSGIVLDASQNGNGHFGRFAVPSGRGRGRGPPNLLSKTLGKQWNSSTRVYDEDDESNEINNWLVNSKSKEPVSGTGNNSVSKDPLPGSEEARTNAIKEAADRLKQALKNKKNVSLNKLLSPGDESKNDNQSHSKVQTLPKNLAQLELDASDMRAIGRANTENTNCLAEDNSDDDIIELQRPPSPVPQIIDLEISPTKLYDNSSSSDDSDMDVSFNEKLQHFQNLSLDRDNIPLSDRLEDTQNRFPESDDDIPLNERLQHFQNSSLDKGIVLPSPVHGNAQNLRLEIDDDVPLNERVQHIQNLSLDSDSAHITNVSSLDPKDNDDTLLSERVQHLPNLTENNNEDVQNESNHREDNCVPASQATNDNQGKVDSQTGGTVPISEFIEGKSNSINKCNEINTALNLNEPAVSHRDKSEMFSHCLDNIEIAYSSSDVAVLNADSVRGADCEGSHKSSKSGASSLGSVLPRVALVGSYPSQRRMSKNYPLSPAPNLNQRRRRASSSSLSESSSPKSTHTGSSNLYEHSAKNGNCEPFLSPPPPKILHDSRQRKIINDLKKINQSKLKDLIHNPRSGKLDFAMKQLMKEHRSVLSRTSRDVAEKRIPAEFLNPKSTELPPDDSTLLADFAIDWSSLPGELISTLGDLFHDFNSETPEIITESHCCTPSEPSDISDTDSMFPSCSPNSSNFFNQNNSREEEEKDSLVLTPMQNSTHSASSRRIRVCQFARENVNLASENSEASDNFERSSPEPFLVPVATETDFAVEKLVQMDTNSGPNESRTECKTTEEYQICDKNATCLTAKSSEVVNRSACELLGVEVDDSIITEPLQTQAACVQESASGEKALSNLPSAARARTKNKSGRAKVKNNKNKQPKISKGKRQKFVHLEERSWFVESSCSSKTKLSIQCNTETVPSSKPPTNSTIDAIPLSNQSQSTETVPSENTVVVGTPDHNGIFVTENQNKSLENVPSYITQLSDATDQNQGVTMMPVLMMTVPANETSNAVCNLTVEEMQNRIQEIDQMLQDLLQERCVLAQSLKGAVTADDGSSDATLLQSAPVSLVEDDGAKIEVDCVETVSMNHSTVKKPRESTKRRCSTNGHDMVSKRICLGDPQSSLSIAKLGSNIKSTMNNAFPLETISHMLPAQNCSNNPPKRLETNARKNIPNSHFTNSQTDHEIRHFYNHPPFDYHSFDEVQGFIFDFKTSDTSIFAASSNGLVYWMIDANKKYLQGCFGEKCEVPMRSLQIVNSCLYTVNHNGLLRIYDIPNLVPNCYLHPKPKHTCATAKNVICSVFDWDRVYIGTREGVVICFNTKNYLVEEGLFNVGHPILSMVTSMDEKRRVLIVAFQRHPAQIRDAETGVLLRSFGGHDWTVFRILCHEGLIYCGANKNIISVFCFKTGKEHSEIKSGTRILTMERYGNYLVSGCHDGKIYIHDVKSQQIVFSLAGPGTSFSSICFHRGKFLCGSQDKPLVSITHSGPDEPFVSWDKHGQEDRVSEISETEASVISENKEDLVPVNSENIKDEVPVMSGNKVLAVSKKNDESSIISKNGKDEVFIIPENESDEVWKVRGRQVFATKHSWSKTDLEGNILAFKFVKHSMFAASTKGIVYYFKSLPTGKCPKPVYFRRSGSNCSSITCIEVVSNFLYTGSEDGILSIYSIQTKCVPGETVGPIASYNISNGIQCMEAAWWKIYVGTKVGSVVPFNLKTRFIGEPLFCENSPVLCIKTHKEGPRCVLIVASRQQPIAIRDASNGLLLRSFGSCEWTVYSILCHKNLVYCGTNTNKISAFEFQTGKLKFELNAGQGIIDMKEFRGHLYCGCYDGNIYVFNLQHHKSVCTLKGPGSMILALEFHSSNHLFCSSKDHPLTVYKRPMKGYFKFISKNQPREKSDT